MNRPLRIGVAGSAGVGKTTLALTLAATLDMPVLHEAMRERLEAGFSLAGLSREEHQEILRRDATELAARVEAAHDGCVADRTPLDFLAFWFCNGYGADSPAETADFVVSATAALDRFDLIVVLPWGAVPLVSDGVRFANPWHQLHTQMVIEELHRRYAPPDRLAFMPADIVTPDERCRWALRRAGLAA